MNLQILLATIGTLAITELVSDVLTKTPLWLSRQCVAAFQRLGKEYVLPRHSNTAYAGVQQKRSLSDRLSLL